MKSTITIEFDSAREINEFLRSLNPKIVLQLIPGGETIPGSDQVVEVNTTAAPADQQITGNIEETNTDTTESIAEHVTGEFHRNCRYCEKPFVATHNRTVTCDACRSKKATKPQKAAD